MRIIIQFPHTRLAYGYYGGSQDNPIVQLLVRFYLNKACCVLTYNARGVHPSEGRVSWTMRAECDDMQAAVDHAMQLGIKKMYDRANEAQVHAWVPHVYIAGYSAGSMHASAVRPKLEGAWTGAHVSYLILSYPLGVRWALTCLQTHFFVKCLDELVNLARTSEHVSLDVLYCTRDQFTSTPTYEAWAERMRSLWPAVSLHSIDADHMFSTADAPQTLLDVLHRCSRS